MRMPAWKDPDAINEEVDVLEAMYPEEVSLESWPPTILFRFEGWEAKVNLTNEYPSELPLITISPPVPMSDEGELDIMAATVLSKVMVGEAMLVELFGSLFEEINCKHASVKAVMAEQMSIKKEEQRRLQELQDRQLAHELAQKERNRAAQESTVGVGAQEEEKLPRFDFSQANIRTGEPVTDRKSTFLAFLWPVKSREDVDYGLALLKGNNKIARAAHNMLAWRLVSPATGNLVSECDSDGEGGAGGGLHQLLHNTGAENVAVLVTRWYGGIHLGADRFKHINNCARTLLVREGYVSEGKKMNKQK